MQLSLTIEVEMDKHLVLHFFIQFRFHWSSRLNNGRSRWLLLRRHRKSGLMLTCISIFVCNDALNKLVFSLFSCLTCTYLQANLPWDLLRYVRHKIRAVLASKLLLLGQGFNFNTLWYKFLGWDIGEHIFDGSVLVLLVPLQEISRGSLLNIIAIGNTLAIDVFVPILIQK